MSRIVSLLTSSDSHGTTCLEFQNSEQLRRDSLLHLQAPIEKMDENVVDFVIACYRGDESEAKTLVERDPGLYNKQCEEDGMTGLMIALYFEHHSLCRWLLSLPGLDTSLRDKGDSTALHWACRFDAPLDIVIALARLSSQDTVGETLS